MRATETPTPEEFLVRPGSPLDLTAVHDVYVAATAAAEQVLETRPPDVVRTWIDGLFERGQELWVAERADELLGFVTVRGDWLPLLFVHPGRPGRGVGAALIDLVKALRPHGFGLRVHQANARARAFYLRHGLVELEMTDGSGYHDESPDLMMAWLGDDPLGFLRARIDEADDDLAVLLARRTALTAAVQDHKAAIGVGGGEQGRDVAREQEIIDRMSRHVPGLERDQLARVMRTVIAESLAAWERRT